MGSQLHVVSQLGVRFRIWIGTWKWRSRRFGPRRKTRHDVMTFADHNREDTVVVPIIFVEISVAAQLSAQASLSHCDCPWGDKLIRVTVAGITVQDPPASRQKGGIWSRGAY